MALVLGVLFVAGFPAGFVPVVTGRAPVLLWERLMVPVLRSLCLRFAVVGPVAFSLRFRTYLTRVLAGRLVARFVRLSGLARLRFHFAGQLPLFDGLGVGRCVRPIAGRSVGEGLDLLVLHFCARFRVLLRRRSRT